MNDGEIVEICDSKASLPAVLYSMEYDGYIFPGLIDTHNHIGWNSVPMWRPGRLFNNRYEWRGDDGPDPVLVEDPEYVEKVQIPHKNVADAWLGSTSGYYAEIRACVGGTTMIQGANKPYPGSLARNLENYGVYSKVTDVTLASPGEIAEARGALYYGYINRLFLHVAEGVDPRSWSEFQFIDAVGLTMPGVAVIHGIPLTPDDFEDALHISIATVYGIDYLLTWNFKHMANVPIPKRIAALTRSLGFEMPAICTPLELIGE